jgi:Phosphotransferase enzyme family
VDRRLHAPVIMQRVESAERLAAARVIVRDLPGRAVSAARTAAERLGIEAADAYPLRTSFSVYVHLAPSPVVARVAVFTPLLRDRLEAWLGRELAVVSALDRLGVPVVRPVDPRVHLADGLRLSLWELVDHDADALPTPAQAGGLLADLHAALRDVPIELADQRLPAFDDLEIAGVPAAELDALAADIPARPTQVLHGDASPGNMLLTRRGWLWHDFEETCVGPIEWDMATLSRSRLIDGKSALRHYPNAPAFGSLEPWIELRARQAALWLELHSAIEDGLD